MNRGVDPKFVRSISKAALPLGNLPANYAPILNSINDDTRVVMIGEASHGTDEFYRHRAEITKRLITEKGFNIIALESDWPDCFRVNKYVKGFKSSHDKNANDALSEYKRFPRWMWRNTVMVEFVEWLKQHNSRFREEKDKTGIFGLDVYSLRASRDEVIKHLEKEDPELVAIAKKYYGCFDPYEDEQEYGQYAGLKMSKSCEQSTIRVLQAMLEKQLQIDTADKEHVDMHFIATQNAFVVQGAEKYFRCMFEGGVSTWNIREQHMLGTLLRLLGHYDNFFKDRTSKAVIWAHNSHVGDARATAKSTREEVTIGQLVRETIGLEKSLNVGFTTNDGTVTAAHNWDDDPHFMKVNKGMEGSYENLFHHVVEASDPKVLPDRRFMLQFRSNNDKSHIVDDELKNELSKNRHERAIGVIYRPKTEFWSHYIDANIVRQFDFVIHVDRTNALRPLEIHPQWAKGEKDHVPETYPYGV